MAQSHGFLAKPASRNALAWDKGEFFCPHCLAAGGPGVTGAHVGIFPVTETPNTAFRHGLCGDESSGRSTVAGQKWLNTAPVLQGTYQAGGAIEIELNIDTNHAGVHSFYLCDTPKSMLQSAAEGQRCLNKHPLLRAAPGPEDTPINTNQNTKWYMPPADDGAVTDGPAIDTARWSATPALAEASLNKPLPAQIMKMKFWLPDDVECEHCVLQWYWQTANSCNPEGYEAGGFVRSDLGHPEWAREGSMGQCGSPSAGYPEEFWNCADIRVVAAPGTPSTPATPAPATPAPGPNPSG